MQIESDCSLAPYTSFHIGGAAEKAIILNQVSRINEALELVKKRPVWLLGYGSNTLVSDKGLEGTTLIIRGGAIDITGDLLIADAGVWWDDLVQYAVTHGLWGIECMSAIPGGIGAAVVGNIAAYGQAVADTLAWAEVYDLETGTCKKVASGELGLSYRMSKLLQSNRSLIVLRAAFRLSTTPTSELQYESALAVARTRGYASDTLQGRRDTILAARDIAGSLWDYRQADASRTAGSFFRNPLVDTTTAERIMRYDETGTSINRLKKMNQIHGGTAQRVSAAHVLLAAGFRRGQTWFDGAVRLHPQHVLKLENARDATAQQIYDVAQEIIHTVKTTLNIDLDPEIRFLGQFDQTAV